MKQLSLLALAALGLAIGQPSLAQSYATTCTREYNSSVNLRNAPSRGASVVASIPNGEYVRILNWVWGGDGMKWYRVENSGLVGFMRSDYLCR